MISFPRTKFQEINNEIYIFSEFDIKKDFI